MKFGVDFNKDKFDGDLKYIIGESSLFFESKSGGYSCSSILINDVELVVADDNSIMFVEGYFPRESWNNGRLIVPKSTVGRLYVDDENYIADDNEGISKRLTKPNEWNVVRDLSSGWFRIGRSSYVNSVIVEFCSNHKAVLDASGKLLELWIKPKFN